jgi:hypothetical protein
LASSLLNKSRLPNGMDEPNWVCLYGAFGMRKGALYKKRIAGNDLN